MTREQKQAFVTEFRERLERAEAIFLTDFTGLDVKAMSGLRRRLRRSGGQYLVVKNRLVKRALADTDLPDISGFLAGPTGIVFGDDDVVAAARTVAEFAKDHGDRPAFKVGVLEASVLDASQIHRVAAMPPRDELLARVAGALGGPMAGLAATLSGKLQEMAGLVEALRENQESRDGGS